MVIILFNLFFKKTSLLLISLNNLIKKTNSYQNLYNIFKKKIIN